MDTKAIPQPAQNFHGRSNQNDSNLTPKQDSTRFANTNESRSPEETTTNLAQSANRHQIVLHTENSITEIRRDYLHSYYVLVAPKRRGRPYDTTSHDHPLVETASSPHLELQQLIYDFPDKIGGWSVRVVENKFPALTPENPRAYGKQEIVIDTPLVNTEFGDLATEQIVNVLKTYQARSSDLLKMPHINYVSIFRNDGFEAGASLAHAHSQIYALPFTPPRIKSEAETIQQYISTHNEDPFQAILHFEQEEKSRIIESNADWISFCPYASQWQMEAWILPRRRFATLQEATDKELTSLAPLLQKISARLNRADISFNMSVEQGVSEHQRLAFKFRGRNVFGVWGGLEVTTGIIINVVPPEAAADWYRRED
ncbi:hypothetical protein KBC99_01490 [Candidatus Saccharibacteria bacterium]|nr:hypothetical protein [Candidatus Saccharibacteria bacterium]